MKPRTRLQLLLSSLLALRLALADDTVSIYVALSTAANHDCVRNCLFDYHDSDLGVALKCATDYENDCYCATASASVSAADSWFAACATSACSAGDVTGDITAMHSIYASYCMGAGYTQPGATAWYNPAGLSPSATPGSTGSSSLPATKTEVTLVTQTAASSMGHAVSQTQVTVHVTSTVLVDSHGSPIPESSKAGGSSEAALGAGLGAGIPVALAAVGAIWFFMRRRSKQAKKSDSPPPVETEPDSPKPEIFAKQMPVGEVDGTGIRSELDVPRRQELEGTPVHELPGEMEKHRYPV